MWSYYLRSICLCQWWASSSRFVGIRPTQWSQWSLCWFPRCTFNFRMVGQGLLNPKFLYLSSNMRILYIFFNVMQLVQINTYCQENMNKIWQRICYSIHLCSLLKVNKFQKDFLMSSFRPKKQHFFKDFCPSLKGG